MTVIIVKTTFLDSGATLFRPGLYFVKRDLRSSETIIYYYTVDMSLSDVHLCSKSAMLMRTVFGIGTASIHSPSLRSTCTASRFFTWIAYLDWQNHQMTSLIPLEIPEVGFYKFVNFFFKFYIYLYFLFSQKKLSHAFLEKNSRRHVR